MHQARRAEASADAFTMHRSVTCEARQGGKQRPTPRLGYFSLGDMSEWAAEHKAAICGVINLLDHQNLLVSGNLTDGLGLQMAQL